MSITGANDELLACEIVLAERVKMFEDDFANKIIEYLLQQRPKISLTDGIKSEQGLVKDQER